MKISEQVNIRGFHLDVKRKYLFAGTLAGKVHIIDTSLPSKEHLMKEISFIEGNPKIRIIRYNPKRHELITGDGNGRIVVFDLVSGSSVYAWEAHKDEITQMYFDEYTNNLITGGKDKKLCVWKIPEKWIDDELEKFEKEDRKQQRDAHAILKLKTKLISIDNEDSDDDLNGWDFRKS